MPDLKGWLSPYLPKLLHHSNPNVFKIVRRATTNGQTVTVFLWKYLNSTDEEWKGDNSILLSEEPGGLPEYLQPNTLPEEVESHIKKKCWETLSTKNQNELSSFFATYTDISQFDSGPALGLIANQPTQHLLHCPVALKAPYEDYCLFQLIEVPENLSSPSV